MEIARIYEDAHTGASAALLRYRAGSRVPAHRHLGYEHVLVLEGEQRDEQGRYAKGSFVVNLPGSQHAVWSPDGCLVLVIWERPVEFLNE